MSFEPELGQMCWSGTPWQQYPLPNYIYKGLCMLGEYIEKNNLSWDDPTSNSGATFENDTFAIRAYCWAEESPQALLPNFEYGDIKVAWYKNAARSASINKHLTYKEWCAVGEVCMKSLKQSRKEYWERADKIHKIIQEKLTEEELRHVRLI